MTSIQAQTLYPNLYAADEQVSAAFDAVAVVGVWALWLLALAGAVFVAALLATLLARETRRSVGGTRSPRPPALSRRPAPRRERRERQEQKAALAPHAHLRPN